MAAVLGGLSSPRGRRVEELLLLVPQLTDGALVSADVALGADPEVLALGIRIGTQPRPARTAERLAFWFARERGWCRVASGLTPAQAGSFGAAFSRCALSVRDVRPAAWSEAVRLVFAALGVAALPEVPAAPELRLHLGGTGWDGFRFEPASRRLEIPSPLAPPAGDVVRVVLERPPAAQATARATVLAVRRPAEASAGAPAGFTLVLDRFAREAARLLQEACAEPRGGCSRRAPRHRVFARAALSDPGEELRYESHEAFLRDYVTNLSHGGAFVRTSRPRAVGDRLDLLLVLAGGSDLSLPATVVHRSAHGVGVQFALTPEVEASLSAAVAGLAARPRRVLVVDDDALVRGILVDVLQAAGFETITAPDGEAGLRAIAEELLSLDAVVTDVRMPGLSGEALVTAVRKAGGEADLVLVVLSASLDPELAARLDAAGADRVLSKAAGPARIVAEVEAALEARRAASAPGAGARPGAAPREASALAAS